MRLFPGGILYQKDLQISPMTVSSFKLITIGAKRSFGMRWNLSLKIQKLILENFMVGQ